MHYFAYGSNMLRAQMAERCPGAQLLGPARLEGWRFLTTKRGTANIVRDRQAIVHGALWRCTPRHLYRLDQFEGVSFRNYLRRFVTVRRADGHECSALIYWAPRHLPGTARIDYLTTALIPGAEALGLPENYVEELRHCLKSKFVIGMGRNRYRGRNWRARRKSR